MQPTPRAQDTPDAPEDDARWIGAEAVALRTQLYGTLGPADRAVLDQLIGAVATHCDAAGAASEQHVWRAVLAHVPGIAPALEIVEAHVNAGYYHCPASDLRGDVATCCTIVGL